MMNFWSSGALILIGRGLTYLQSILLIPIVVKLAGPETFGAFSLVTTALGFVYAASPLGVGYRARRDLAAAPSAAERKRLFFPQFWFHVATLALFALLLRELIGFLGSEAAASELVIPAWMGIAYLYAYLLYGQPADYLFYTHRVARYAAGTVAFPYLFLGLALAGYFTGAGLTVSSLVLAQAVAAATVGAVLAAMVWRETGLLLALPTFRMLREDLRFGFPLLMVAVLEIVLSAADRFVILGVLSVKAVGYYVPAYTLAMLVMLYPRVFGGLLVPGLARELAAGRNREAEQLVAVVIRGFIALAVPFAVGSLVLGRPVLELFTNTEAAEAAWGILPIVAVGSFFYGINVIYASVLTVRSKTHELFVANLQAALLNVALNVALLPVFRSLFVPAAATVISFFVASIMLLRQVRECWRVELHADFVLRVAAASVLMGVVAEVAFQASNLYAVPRPLPLMLALAVALMSYAAASLVLGVVRKDDLARILAIVQRRAVSSVRAR